MKYLPLSLTALLAAVILSTTAPAAVIVQYSFEGNLLDTAAGGASANDLTYVQGLSLSGSAAYVPGIPGLGGSASLFDGNYFTTPDAADLDITTAWTIEAFVSRTTATEWARTVLKWDSPYSYHFGIRNDRLNLFDSGVAERVNADTTPETNFTDGNWHHIAITSSTAGGAQAWIDGISVHTGAAINLTANTSNLGIGDDAAGAVAPFRFLGRMDEVLIHDSAVDQTYINGRAALLVPEPASAAFLAMGALALLRRRR